jgi:ATP-dependent DNA ligase
VKLPRIQPIAPKRIHAPFDHTEFVFELKMDGWRCVTYIEDGACRLISRKQNQFKSFGPLNAALAKLPVRNAIIDAEVVCLDAKGRSVFLDLMRPRKANAILYAFDLLWLNNEDLRNLPSTAGAQRKATAVNPRESKPEPALCEPHGEARRQVVSGDMPAGLRRDRWKIQTRHLHGCADFMGKNFESEL